MFGKLADMPGEAQKFRLLLRKRWKSWLGVRWGESSKHLDVFCCAAVKRAAHWFDDSEKAQMLSWGADPQWLDAAVWNRIVHDTPLPPGRSLKIVELERRSPVSRHHTSRDFEYWMWLEDEAVGEKCTALKNARSIGGRRSSS